VDGIDRPLRLRGALPTAAWMRSTPCLPVAALRSGLSPCASGRRGAWLPRSGTGERCAPPTTTTTATTTAPRLTRLPRGRTRFRPPCSRRGLQRLATLLVLRTLVFVSLRTGLDRGSSAAPCAIDGLAGHWRPGAPLHRRLTASPPPPTATATATPLPRRLRPAPPRGALVNHAQLPVGATGRPRLKRVLCTTSSREQ
jgi:hypothetical protein